MLQRNVNRTRVSRSFFFGSLSKLCSHSNHQQVRHLHPLEKKPGVISLLAGRPNSASFPFTSVSVTSASPSSIAGEETTLTIEGRDLEEALQYSATSGLKQLLDWVHGLQEYNHGRRKGEGWRVSVGSGSQDLLYKVGSSIPYGKMRGQRGTAAANRLSIDGCIDVQSRRPDFRRDTCLFVSQLNLFAPIV